MFDIYFWGKLMKLFILLSVFLTSCICVGQIQIIGPTIILSGSVFGTVTAPTTVIYDPAVTPCSATITSGASTTCTLNNVTVGDTLICGVNGGDEAGNYRFSDPLNGTWSAMNYAHAWAAHHAWVGQWAVSNSAAGTIIITGESTAIGNPLEMVCMAVKNTRTTNFLDVAGDSGDTTAQSSAALSSPITPSGNGEMVVSLLNDGNTPNDVLVPGANFTAISSTNAYLGMEYWTQSTATTTTCPWTSITPPDAYGLSCIILKPSTSTPGVAPYQWLVINFNGIGTTAPTLTTLSLSASGGVNGWVGGEVDTYAYLGGQCSADAIRWALQNTNLDISGSISGPTSLFGTPLYLPTQQILYTGNGAYNLQFTTGTAGDMLCYGVQPNQSSINFGGYIQFNIPQNDSNTHSYIPFGIYSTTNTSLFSLELIPSGTAISAQIISTSNSNVTLGNMGTNTTYWVTGSYNPGGTDSMSFYSGCPGACTLVGNGTIPDQVPSTTYQSLFMGSYNNYGTQASGDDIWFRNIKLCANYPCLP